MTQDDALGDVLARLYAVIQSRRGGDPAASYTAKLLSEGPARCAKKFGEEAVEAALAGALVDAAALREEAADALYHLLVLLAAVDVDPAEVAAVLEKRAGVSGHTEKAARDPGS